MENTYFFLFVFSIPNDLILTMKCFTSIWLIASVMIGFNDDD